MCRCRMLNQSFSLRIVFSFQRKNLHFLLQNDAVSFVVFLQMLKYAQNYLPNVQNVMFIQTLPFSANAYILSQY